MKPLKPEAQEQKQLVDWLTIKWYTFTAIPHATYTPSYNQHRINFVTWVRKGIPDLLIILKRGSLLFLELKRPWKLLKSWKIWASPSTVEPEQLEWIEKLSKIDNVEALLVYGAIEAIRAIEMLEKK